MELKELCDKTLEIFRVKTTKELSETLLDVCKENDVEKMKEFKNLVQDLSIDWLQKIFQYYEADRKEKKQDYTPLSLARFVGKLAGDRNEEVIDLCAGSGSLTIQKWNLDKGTKFILYELDEKVIPFLLFNLVVRNIESVIYHSDVLQNEIFHTYKITKGQEFGIVKEVLQ